MTDLRNKSKMLFMSKLYPRRAKPNWERARFNSKTWLKSFKISWFRNRKLRTEKSDWERNLAWNKISDHRNCTKVNCWRSSRNCRLLSKCCKIRMSRLTSLRSQLTKYWFNRTRWNWSRSKPKSNRKFGRRKLYRRKKKSWN